MIDLPDHKNYTFEEAIHALETYNTLRVDRFSEEELEYLVNISGYTIKYGVRKNYVYKR